MTAFIEMITSLVAQVIVWIPQIIDMALDQPVILFFMAFGLVGALIRWARKLIHFA